MSTLTSAAAAAADNAAADRLVVRGGYGGTVAQLTDLHVAVAVLRRAADRLDVAQQVRASVDLEIAETTWWSPVTAQQVHDALDEATWGRHGTVAVADGLRSTADRLERTAGGYADAEADAEWRLQAVMTGIGTGVGSTLAGTGAAALVVGLAGLLAAAPLARVDLLRMAAWKAEERASGTRRPPPPSLLRSATAGALRTTLDHAGLVQGLFAGLLAGWGPSSVPMPSAATVPAAARGAARLTDLAVPHRDLIVVPRLGPPQVTSAPTGLADIVGRIDRLYPRSGNEPGTVGVQRIDHDDGSRSWVVLVPGTQGMGLGAGGNTLDLDSNLHLAGGLPADSTAVVVAAMAQSGIRPDEPVLLAGHSQGGMIAMAIAADAVLSRRYDITSVATFGSPEGIPLRVPARTSVVHLEHRQDLVPILDGAPNEDAPNRTTVRRDLGASGRPDDRVAAGTPAGAHGTPAYQRTAALADRSNAPSLVAWREQAGEVLGDGTARATVREFTGFRRPTSATPAAPG